MPRRRRLFTPNKHKIKSVPKNDSKYDGDSREVNSARGRFKGALKFALDPGMHSDDSDYTDDETRVNRGRHQGDSQVYLSDEEAKRVLRKSPPRQSYVLKLFDRSVDLSQFRDDSPLYPICRAWMANQPKTNYSELGTNSRMSLNEKYEDGGVTLPAPEGSPVSKVPKLLPEQFAADKNNINLNYRDSPPPTREQLLRMHMPRWAAVKQAWQEQIILKEVRYEKSQEVLNRINLEYPSR